MSKETITRFLSQNPSLSEILEYIETRAQEIAKQRMEATKGV